MKTNIKIILLLLLFLFAPRQSFAAQNILIVHSYNAEHVWTGMLKEGIDRVFANDSQAKLFHEYLDAKRYPKQQHAAQFWSYLNEKYEETPLAVILVSDDAALQALQENRSVNLTNVPVVFMGVNEVSERLVNTPGVTGVFENRNIARTIFDIKTLTQSDELVIISDTETAGAANLSKAKEAVGDPRAPEKLHFIEQLSKENIVTSLERFTSETPVLLLGQLIDGDSDGALMGWRAGTAFLAESVSNPVFTIAIITLDHGAVGADNLDGVLHGEQAARLAKQIAQGVPVESIPVVVEADSLWTLDWQKLKELGYATNSLAERSILVNRSESFYQRYKYLVWIVCAAFALAFVIILMLVEIIRRGNRARDILVESDERYKDLAEVGSIIFWETDPLGKLCYVSGNWSSLLGPHSDTFIGQPLYDVIANDPRVEMTVRLKERLTTHKEAIENLVFRIKSPTKDLQVYTMNATPMCKKPDIFAGYRGVFKEVTQEHQLSQKLAYLASFDSITGLMNRESFYEKVKIHLAGLDTTVRESFVCFLDLDRFKVVNDVAGHMVGDAMLFEVAKVISSCLREGDQLGRLGGDEFGLLFSRRTRVEATALCAEIVKRVEDFHYVWRDRQFTVGVSIGMVPFSSELNEVELLSKADLACYKAKEKGRGQVYVVDLDQNDLHDDELQMGYIANVSQALRQGRFFLVKQKILPVSGYTSDKEHYEILIRYKDDLGKLVSPGLFIPAAEKHGVIGMIDRWVIEEVISRYDQIFSKDDVMVSINISGLSLSSEGFVDYIKDLLETHNVRPGSICMEITETAAISHLSHALVFIEAMKQFGVRFALDDFGSGASSFGYLKKLPVDYLKIDGSLIREIVSEPRDEAIVDSINSVAHFMGMKTIAEFVENEQILKKLSEIGVDYVQGYAIGKPEDLIGNNSG